MTVSSTNGRREAARKLGRIKTPKKSAAARANGTRGGRPVKVATKYEDLPLYVRRLVPDEWGETNVGSQHITEKCAMARCANHRYIIRAVTDQTVGEMTVSYYRRPFPCVPGGESVLIGYWQL